MIEVNVHLVDEASKYIICSTTFKLSPMESKLSLSAIRTGIMGILKAYNSSLSTSGISKNSVDEWPKLKSTEDYSALDNVTVKATAGCLEEFQQYMQTLKNPDSLMFVQVQGQDVMGLSLYDNWYCDDDTTTTEDVVAQVHSSNGTIATGTDTIDTVNFCLAKGFLMPAPTLRVTIRASRTAKDLNGKSYTVYNIFVKQGSLEWFVEHRYSDFSALHEALCKQNSSETGFIRRDHIPRMTTKKILSSKSMNAYTVDKRRIKLGKYLNQLICLEQAMSNRLILSFLGMLNTARFDVVSAKGHPRNIIHLSKLRSEAKAGDIILFKCANTMSHLQRAVTRSEFDHVGIVVRSTKNPGQLDILESTGDGVTTFSLTGRLRAYHHHDFVEYMCIRQLKDYSRTPEVMQAVDEFVGEVVGLPYGFSASQVFSKKQKKSTTSIGKKFTTMLSGRAKKAEAVYEKNQNPDQKPEDETKNKAFFCSELVAAVLKEMNIIPSSLNAEYFWPGCFSKDDEIDTIMKENNLSSFYDDELVIDCRIVEIAKATLADDMIPKKKSQTLDKDIIIDNTDAHSDTSFTSDDHIQPLPISETDKVNSKNVLNEGLKGKDILRPKESLVASSCAKLECSSSDEDEGEQVDHDDVELEDDGEICAPMTTFAPSLF